jgi:hypothetical protein
MENKVPRVLLHKVYAGKDPMNTNGNAKGRTNGTIFTST